MSCRLRARAPLGAVPSDGLVQRLIEAHARFDAELLLCAGHVQPTSGAGRWGAICARRFVPGSQPFRRSGAPSRPSRSRNPRRCSRVGLIVVQGREDESAGGVFHTQEFTRRRSVTPQHDLSYLSLMCRHELADHRWNDMEVSRSKLSRGPWSAFWGREPRRVSEAQFSWGRRRASVPRNDSDADGDVAAKSQRVAVDSKLIVHEAGPEPANVERHRRIR